ncbi:MAG: cytochrome P450, partial [Nannocystaceae bacterium]
MTQQEAQTPGPPGLPVLGSALTIGRMGALPFFESCWRQYGDAYRVRVGGQRWIVLAHPDAVHHVLIGARKRFIKGAAYDPIRLLGGDGIIFKEGPTWLRDRKLMQPSFHQRSIARLMTRMVEDTGQAIERMRRFGGEPFDFHHEMVRLSMQIAGNTLFGMDLSEEASLNAPAMAKALELISERGNSAAPIPMSVPTPSNVRLRRAIGHFDEMVYEIIARARAHASPERDDTLLAMLLTTRDEDTGVGLSDRELRDQIVNLVIAGHETTALLMTWTWAFLAKLPDIRERVIEEVDRVLGDRPPRLEDLPALTLTKQVLQESMRLRPPLWAVARNCIEDDVIGGHHVPAGTLVIMPSYLTHRHPGFWDHPERFEPERFSAEASAGRHKCAYFPFSTGPRICLGDTFAMVEGQLILAMLLQQCRGALVGDGKIIPDARISLRPKGPVMVRSQWRDEQPVTSAPEQKQSSPLVRPLRWINKMGATLAGRGIRVPNLSEESLIATARQKTGLEDLGDEAFR